MNKNVIKYKSVSINDGLEMFKPVEGECHSDLQK